MRNHRSIDPEVRPGDLWILSWDNKFLGLALIAAVKQGYVLAWPVTLAGEPRYAPALVVEDSPLGASLAVWPSREVGLGNHLLHRSLGPMIGADRIQPIAWAMEDGADPGLPFAEGAANDEANRAHDEQFLARWSDICFHTWPTKAMQVLSSEKIRRLGGSASAIAKTLGLESPAVARPLWTGVLAITEAQAETAARSLGVDVPDVLGEDPFADVVARMTHPKFKAAVEQVAQTNQMTEGQVRDAARCEFALAVAGHDVVDTAGDAKGAGLSTG